MAAKRVPSQTEYVPCFNCQRPTRHGDLMRCDSVGGELLCPNCEVLCDE